MWDSFQVSGEIGCVVININKYNLQILRPRSFGKVKGLKIAVDSYRKLKNLSGSFESEINLKMDFKPDFLNLALVPV